MVVHKPGRQTCNRNAKSLCRDPALISPASEAAVCAIHSNIGPKLSRQEFKTTGSAELAISSDLFVANQVLIHVSALSDFGIAFGLNIVAAENEILEAQVKFSSFIPFFV